jgi:hypothetical protein
MENLLDFNINLILMSIQTRPDVKFYKIWKKSIFPEEGNKLTIDAL